VAIVDTPGFDDTTRSDSEILDEVSRFLVYQYLLGIPLKGIIYMHRITDNRMQGTARRYFEMFQRLCGENGFGNVVLLTTMWSQLLDEGLGLRRDQELRESYWNLMEKKGSKIQRYDGSASMAEAIVCRLMRKPTIVLDIQRELVDEGRQLEDTTAGQLILPRLEARMALSARKIGDLEKLIATADAFQTSEETKRLEIERASFLNQQQKDLQRRERLKAKPGPEAVDQIEKAKRSHKWRDRVSMFASVLGLVLSAAVNVILPLAGVAI
jgi:hypothetical protein